MWVSRFIKTTTWLCVFKFHGFKMIFNWYSIHFTSLPWFNHYWLHPLHTITLGAIDELRATFTVAVVRSRSVNTCLITTMVSHTLINVCNRNNVSPFLIIYYYLLPPHELPSFVSGRNPSSQEQLYPPRKSVQICSQPPLSTSHSRKSEYSP